jgi:acyl-CoA thioester hydrolase
MSARRTDAPSPILHGFPLRIYYEDTDFSGNVYHASYLRFMERARTEWVRQTGFDQRSAFMATPSIVFVVRRMVIDYLKPAHMDDEVMVETALVEARGASLRLAQRIRRGEELLVDAEVLIASLSDGRPARLPSEILRALPSPS